MEDTKKRPTAAIVAIVAIAVVSALIALRVYNALKEVEQEHYTANNMQWLRHVLLRIEAYKQRLPGVYDGEVTKPWRVELLYWYAEYTNELSGMPSDPREIATPELYCSDMSLRQLNIAAVIGCDTPFGSTAIRLDELDDDTIMFIQVTGTSAHWADTCDLRLPLDGAQSQFIGVPGGGRNGGFAIGYADGEVWSLSADTPLSEVEKLVTISGAREVNRDDVLGKFAIKKYSKRQ